MTEIQRFQQLQYKCRINILTAYEAETHSYN